MSMPSTSVANKTYLVAGASGRIGRAIVDELLAAGANVCAIDVQSTASADFDGRVMRVEADISDRTKVEQALVDATERYGHVHGAVNSAYPRNPRYGRHFYDVEFQDFHENVGLHLGAYFVFMQQCAKYSDTRKSLFSLVNLSSIYGVIVPKFEIYEGTDMTMPVEYAAIKSGLHLLTKYASAYTGPYFRANCVSPGGILDRQDTSFLEKYRRHCQSKGMLEAADVMGAITFLLSDQSRYMVGQNLVVDDGFTL